MIGHTIYYTLTRAFLPQCLHESRQHIYTHTHIHTHTLSHTHTYTHAHTHVCMHAHTMTQIHMHTHSDIHAKHILTHGHTHIYTMIQTHTDINSRTNDIHMFICTQTQPSLMHVAIYLCTPSYIYLSCVRRQSGVLTVMFFTYYGHAIIKIEIQYEFTIICFLQLYTCTILFL